MRQAASSRHFGVLKLMYRIMMASNPLVAAEWHPSFCADTASSGNTRMLKWLREHGFQWDSLTIANAAGEGHISVLKWAIDNGCAFDERACAKAALGGHLHVLKYLSQRMSLRFADRNQCRERTLFERVVLAPPTGLRMGG